MNSETVYYYQRLGDEEDFNLYPIPNVSNLFEGHGRDLKAAVNKVGRVVTASNIAVI